MSDTTVVEEIENLSAPKPKMGVGVIGVPLAYGASMAGVELGPAALRVAKLNRRIARLGYEVQDLGDLEVEEEQAAPDPADKLKHLREISATCEELAQKTEEVLNAGKLPLILGGDHSIAIGSISGFSSYCRKRSEQPGLIWFDAHADMNTPETSPSGNIHGMPLAVLLGFGAPQLTNIADFSPKLDPALCVHIGARDIDHDERALVRKLGIRFMTMREIDERGMSVCIDEAIKIASRASGGYAVTFDVDALDPGDAPGSGTLVRGGLTYREAHLAMEKIAEAGGMRSLEVVEINTALDVNNKTAELGVELILSALGKTIL
ncbi:MAG TPA: arginase [Pyrinomonadaceae bacterium]|jgi:arginase|nr:arginase [Pyrinomonadaceae bacterium]